MSGVKWCQSCARWNALAEAAQLGQTVAEKRAARLEAALLAKSDAYDALVAERDILKDDLAFVERWANHHAMKPHVTPAQALGVIQHYPPISKITKGYSDGVLPDTRNPWAELAALEARIEAAPVSDEVVMNHAHLGPIVFVPTEALVGQRVRLLPGPKPARQIGGGD